MISRFVARFHTVLKRRIALISKLLALSKLLAAVSGGFGLAAGQPPMNSPIWLIRNLVCVHNWQVIIRNYELEIGKSQLHGCLSPCFSLSACVLRLCQVADS